MTLFDNYVSKVTFSGLTLQGARFGQFVLRVAAMPVRGRQGRTCLALPVRLTGSRTPLVAKATLNASTKVT